MLLLNTSDSGWNPEDFQLLKRFRFAL